jgi:hypothetical protein
MRPLNVEFVFKATFEVPPPAQIGALSPGTRRVSQIVGGSVEGPALGGRVISGSDWLMLRNDGVLEMDARLTIESNKGRIVTMRYSGYRHGPKEVLERLGRGEPVDPDSYYFRTVPSFESAAPELNWLNKALFVATGTRSASGPTYYVYAIR